MRNGASSSTSSTDRSSSRTVASTGPSVTGRSPCPVERTVSQNPAASVVGVGGSGVWNACEVAAPVSILRLLCVRATGYDGPQTLAPRSGPRRAPSSHACHPTSRVRSAAADGEVRRQEGAVRTSRWWCRLGVRALAAALPGAAPAAIAPRRPTTPPTGRRSLDLAGAGDGLVDSALAITSRAGSLVRFWFGAVSNTAASGFKGPQRRSSSSKGSARFCWSAWSLRNLAKVGVAGSNPVVRSTRTLIGNRPGRPVFGFSSTVRLLRS